MDTMDEIRLTAEQLKHLANEALCAIREHNELAIEEILKLREPLLESVRGYVHELPELVAACPAIHEAANLEASVAEAARQRRDSLYNEWMDVRQRSALRKAYDN